MWHTQIYVTLYSTSRMDFKKKVTGVVCLLIWRQPIWHSEPPITIKEGVANNWRLPIYRNNRNDSDNRMFYITLNGKQSRCKHQIKVSFLKGECWRPVESEMGVTLENQVKYLGATLREYKVKNAEICRQKFNSIINECTWKLSLYRSIGRIL